MGSSPLQPAQPFSAAKPRGLPTYGVGQDLVQLLATWKAHLDPLINNVAPQPTPLNFSATNSRGGITLNWSPVANGDGYEILKSVNGSFSDDLQVIPIKDVKQSSFFDGLGGNSQAANYRIRTTSGTPANPQSQRGPESGVVTHRSIDASDTTTKSTTVFDTYTTDKTRSLSRQGNYGAVRQTPLGKSGGPTVGVGTKNRGVNPAGTPPSGSSGTPAVGGQTGSGGSGGGSVGSGVTNSLDLVLSSPASITPDPDNPGIIDATELQGTQVSTTAPSDQNILHYSADDEQWEPSATIDLGSNGVRNLTLQVLRGTQAELSTIPLAQGEIYFADDTGNVYLGLPGVGLGYAQIGDMSQMTDLLIQVLNELRAARLALTKLACDGGGAAPSDFDPERVAADGQSR